MRYSNVISINAVVVVLSYLCIGVSFSYGWTDFHQNLQELRFQEKIQADVISFFVVVNYTLRL